MEKMLKLGKAWVANTFFGANFADSQAGGLKMTTASSWLRGYAQFAVGHRRSKDMPDWRIMGFLAGPACTPIYNASDTHKNLYWPADLVQNIERDKLDDQQFPQAKWWWRNNMCLFVCLFFFNRTIWSLPLWKNSPTSYITSTNNADCRHGHWPAIRRTHGWRLLKGLVWVSYWLTSCKWSNRLIPH